MPDLVSSAAIQYDRTANNVLVRTGTRLKGKHVNKLWLTLLSLALSGCSAIVGLPVGQAPQVDPSRDGPPLTVVDVASKPLPIPKNEPRIKRGNVSPYTVFGVTYEVMPSAAGYQEIGTASWYGRKFHGRLTSSGEVYDMFEFTAAHKSLPIPSYVQVTNLANQEQIIVRVNDRGPFAEGRLIDLSWAAAQRVGFADKGTARVELVILAHPDAAENSAVPVESKTGAQPKAKPSVQPRVQPRYQILALSDSEKAQQAMLKALESLGMDTAQGQLSAVTIGERPIWRVILSPANAKQTQLLLQNYTDAKLLTN